MRCQKICINNYILYLISCLCVSWMKVVLFTVKLFVFIFSSYCSVCDIKRRNPGLLSASVARINHDLIWYVNSLLKDKWHEWQKWLTATLRICCPPKRFICCRRALNVCVFSGGKERMLFSNTPFRTDILQPAPTHTPTNTNHCH